MALTQCPECDGKVSDRAVSCPHCGYPLSQSMAPSASSPPKEQSKRNVIRLPKGYGTVRKLSGKRSKPYGAFVNPRKVLNEEKKISYYEYDYLESFKTRTEGITAIINYHENPYDLSDKDITFEDLYKKWSSSYYKKLKSSRSYRAAYNHCKDLHRLKFKDIRTSNIEELLNTPNLGKGTYSSLKNLFGQMYRYAIKNEIVQKNYFKMCDLDKRDFQPIIERAPFTKSEIQAIWDNINFPYADMVLLGLYTGFRPQEICDIEREKVDLEKGIIIGGMKTEAGTDRIIPIHHRIREIVKNWYNSSNGQTYLFNSPEGHVTYKFYRSRFNEFMNSLGFSHYPHDTRHTFITLLDNSGANETCIKLLVGHSLEDDITKSVYTHKSIEDLRKVIELLQ